ncbi:putative undecaprenyl-diphosphatase [Selenomonas ruminantium subsp. lactilytica TAM6421]|uniref:Undecaprenyl-diphosphatase n=1 Tax=Selenomonas ruminantium subsp. lactilytica (strain NBRC 103574 / TAM6421) TaxID=927704 RepID=I0GSW0_SELRL|nr:undecaprenyl-diphosphate phosphatase [Selenomonas ruminantium]BAL83847.1 putative undecaprenyl-diphosphatase [Selenomonas ruminantium subsp. lactilytica TAM6421]
MDLSIAELLKVVVLGIVEGLTEWLPVSSTGHMILVDEFIKLDVSKDFMDMFLVVIQLGAILAVVALNFEKLNPWSDWKTRQEKRDTVSLWFKVIIACVPAAVIGLAFNDYMEEHFMTAPVVAATLIFYGAMFIWIENYNKHRRPRINDLARLDYRTAFIIGMFQVLSLVPGTSRSGATIIGGILFGTSRIVAAEFTFFLAIPVMFGASLLKMVKFGLHYTGAEIVIMIVGMVTAFIVSIISIKFLLSYIKTNDFKAFGWYRIVLGIVVIAYLFLIGDPTADNH